MFTSCLVLHFCPVHSQVGRVSMLQQDRFSTEKGPAVVYRCTPPNSWYNMFGQRSEHGSLSHNLPV